MGTGTTSFSPALTNSSQMVSVSDESGLTCTLGAESATMEWSNSGTIADGRYEGALFVLASEFLSANGSGTPLLCPAGFGTVSSASTAETLTITSPV